MNSRHRSPTIKMVKLQIIQIAQLNRDHCKIKNPDRVEMLLNAFIAGGHEKLQLISDFDFTLTKHRLTDGTKMVSTHAILEKCPSVPEYNRNIGRNLFLKYRPIEIDGTIPISEKTDVMIEWWSQSSKNFS